MIHTALMYTVVFYVRDDSIWSKCCEFFRSTAGLQLTIFAGWPAGRTGTLPVGLGHKNLDLFHLGCDSSNFLDHSRASASIDSLSQSNMIFHTLHISDSSGRPRYVGGSVQLLRDFAIELVARFLIRYFIDRPMQQQPRFSLLLTSSAHDRRARNSHVREKLARVSSPIAAASIFSHEFRIK